MAGLEIEDTDGNTVSLTKLPDGKVWVRVEKGRYMDDYWQSIQLDSGPLTVERLRLALASALEESQP